MVLFAALSGNVLADLNDGLVAYYPFNGNAQDESGNGNHATVNQPQLTQNRFGNPNSAYEFDGVDDRMVVLSSKSLNPANQLTIAFWIKINSTTNEPSPIIWKGLTRSNNREYSVWLKKELYFHLALTGDGSSTHHYLNSNAVQLKEWIFYTTIIDRRNHFMKVYLNGVLNAQTRDSYSSFNNNDENLEFGGLAERSNNFSAFNGVLDDIRIYNRALTESEVMELFREGNSTPPVEEKCTKAEIDAAYEAGRQACIKNPESCDISTDGVSGGAATYSLTNQILHIPAIEVPIPFAGTQIYKSDMKYVPSNTKFGFHFEIKTLEVVK